ncbi:MAG: alpha/beta fold hydrolase [Actinobacteria bacterium]|nr:alpha/beta fold hydrolase [Actinomycetota bacterium]
MTAATEMSGLEARTFAGAGGHVRYFAGGVGEPLLLLHGLGGSAANWVELLPLLVGRFRVLVPDLPGHAASAPLPRGAGVADFADVAARILEAEERAATLVAGHSFGGLVALRLAQRRPELVRGLLLVAPAGIGSGTRLVQAVVLANATIRPGRWVAPLRFRYADRAWYRRALFRPWFVSDADALSADATHGLLAGVREHVDLKVAGRAMIADDPRSELDAVRCPAVLVWGARDAQLPLDDAFEYARRLRAKLRIVSDCGHLVPVERPAACLDALEALRGMVVRSE